MSLRRSQYNFATQVLDVLLRWLSTDTVQLNAIDAENPTLTDMHHLPHTEKLAEQLRTCLQVCLLFVHCLSGWHTHTHSLSLSLTHTHTHTHSLTHSFTHTHTHTHTHNTHAHIHTYIDSVAFTLTTATFIPPLAACFQEGEDIPRDVTQLFDHRLHSIDTSAVPDAVEACVLLSSVFFSPPCGSFARFLVTTQMRM